MLRDMIVSSCQRKTYIFFLLKNSIFQIISCLFPSLTEGEKETCILDLMLELGDAVHVRQFLQHRGPRRAMLPRRNSTEKYARA
jgi:hypothetical protein